MANGPDNTSKRQLVAAATEEGGRLWDYICSAIGMTAAANRMPPEFCTFILDPEGGHGGSPWMEPIIRTAELNK
jgi:hypothetical protein